MLTISVWPRRLKEFLLTHPLYKSPPERGYPSSLQSPRPRLSPDPDLLSDSVVDTIPLISEIYERTDEI